MSYKQSFTVGLTFIAVGLFAQARIDNSAISGRLIDGTTLSPIAYATVFVKNTSNGALSNFEGMFSLGSIIAGDTLVIQHVSYAALEVPYRPVADGLLVCQLLPKTTLLDEIVVKPGKSLVLRLLDSVQVYKNDYNYALQPFAEYVSENNLMVYFRRFSEIPPEKEKLFYRKAFRDYSVVLGDSASRAIPGYSSTYIMAVQKSAFPQKTSSLLLDSDVDALAFETSEFVQQLAQVQSEINLYDEQVPILGKNFISPIAALGPMFYKYKIADTVFIDSLACIGIEVQPKNSQALCFTGKIWVAKDEFALKRATLETTGETGINFINRIKIEQNLQADGLVWVPVSTRMLIDAVNIYALNTQYQHAHRFYHQKPAGFFKDVSNDSSGQLINQIDFGLLKTDTLYALSTRALDSLRHLPSVSVSARLIETSVKGFYNLGKVEVGPYLLLYNSNQVEGSRFRLGFRTKDNFSRQMQFSGYAAYGTRDKALKYSASLETFLYRPRWMKLGVQYLDDVRNLGAIDEFYSQNSFLTLATSGGSDQMHFIRVGRAWFETDITPAINTKIVYGNAFFEPASQGFIFAYYPSPAKDYIEESLHHQSIHVQLWWQPGILWSYDDNRRFAVDMNFSPRFQVSYNFGWVNQWMNFYSISGQYVQRYPIPGMGQMKLNLKVQKNFRATPYPLLSVLSGNETIFRSEATYNLMNYGEFIADELVEGYWIWHFDGAILGRIPLIKKLDWRLLTDVHAAWGDFNEDTNGMYDPDVNPKGILSKTDAAGNAITQFGALNPQEPYVEVAYGIENIFKFVRVDAIHRLTYRDNPGASKFGVKVSGVFRF